MQEPIRILQIIGRMDRGGAESMIMTLYRNIDRKKIRFDFLVHTDKKCAFDDEIKELGGEIFRIPRYTVKNHFAYRKSLHDFFMHHQEHQLIHCHMNSTAAIIVKCAKKCGKKTIVHSHNTSYESGLSNRIKEILQIPLKNEKNTDFRFSCGTEAGKWLFGKLEFTVINNAIDSNKFIFNQDVRDEIREKYNLQNKFVIGNIARFDLQKNHDFIVNIFNDIYIKDHDAVLLLVGDGPLRKTIEDKVNRLGLEECVIFTGVQSNVSELLMAMDVFVFPSLFEGLGIVLIEAQASGLKSFTSGSVVPDEAQVTNLLEYISLEESAQYWAEKVLECENEYERRDMQDEIIRAGYDISTTVKWLEEFYINEWSK